VDGHLKKASIGQYGGRYRVGVAPHFDSFTMFAPLRLPARLDLARVAMRSTTQTPRALGRFAVPPNKSELHDSTPKIFMGVGADMLGSPVIFR
jgi:hypothetical protein